MNNIFEELKYSWNNYEEIKRKINKIGDNFCKSLHNKDNNILPTCEEVKYIKENKKPVKVIYCQYSGIEYEFCFKYMTLEEFMSYDTTD